MTRALAALALAMCAASASADTLRWHAPTVLRDGSPAHDRQDQIVLRLRGQWPAYYPGVWLVPGDWTALVAWCRPDTDAVLRAVLPGAACSLAVAPGQHVVVARNGKGAGVWSNVVVVP